MIYQDIEYDILWYNIINYIFMYKQNTVQYTIFTTSPTWFDSTPKLGGFSFYKTTSTKGSWNTNFCQHPSDPRWYLPLAPTNDSSHRYPSPHKQTQKIRTSHERVLYCWWTVVGKTKVIWRIDGWFDFKFNAKFKSILGGFAYRTIFWDDNIPVQASHVVPDFFQKQY